MTYKYRIPGKDSDIFRVEVHWKPSIYCKVLKVSDAMSDSRGIMYITYNTRGIWCLTN